MIFKEFDSKQETLNTLKKLLKESNSESQKALIAKDLSFLTSGVEAEQQNAYYINFYLKDSKNLMVLHDVRIEHNGRTAQIDHMLISRFGIELFESKSFKGQLTINEDNSLQVSYNGTPKSYPNPLEQSKRHAEVLKEFIHDNANLGKRIKLLGGFDIDNIVLMHPQTTITNKKLPNKFFRADTYISQRTEEIDKIGVVQMFKLVSKMIDIDSVKYLAELIKNAHTPVNFDYTNKYKISKIHNDSKVEEPENEKIKEEKNIPIKSASEQLKVGDACPFCKSELVLRKGKTKFLGCSSYPKCHFSRGISKELVT